MRRAAKGACRAGAGTCQEGRLPGLGDEAEYVHLLCRAGFAVSSVEDVSAAVARTNGEASLAVSDDKHEGAAASVVVSDASGRVLDSKPTTVGEDP
jgi:hypothetical protein